MPKKRTDPLSHVVTDLVERFAVYGDVAVTPEHYMGRWGVRVLFWATNQGIKKESVEVSMMSYHNLMQTEADATDVARRVQELLSL